MNFDKKRYRFRFHKKNNNLSSKKITHKYIIISIIFIILTIIVLRNNRTEKDYYIYEQDKIDYMGKKVKKEKLLNDYLSRVSDDYIDDKKEERKRFTLYYNLFKYSNNDSMKNKLKKNLLGEISRLKKQNITKLDTFYLSHKVNFGNNIIAVNNAIFYCEVIGCNKIILNNKNQKKKWLIINPIYINELNITIIHDSKINCENPNVFCFYENSWDIFYPRIITPKIETNYIRNEIFNNLPIININSNDLYIHIRGGDVFQKNPLKYYSQPPLCFYERIINNIKFENIYIVSMDNNNIVIDSLTKKYNKITNIKNKLDYDIALLCNAYNIVLSVSSFAISSIKLNYNLKKIWEYDIMRLSEKFLFLHHHIFNFKISYKIYTMKPSDTYASKMFSWSKSKEQINLMLTDKCPYDFVETIPNK